MKMAVWLFGRELLVIRTGDHITEEEPAEPDMLVRNNSGQFGFADE